MINWFPGHMKKTYDNLIKQLDNFDFVIEILDARAINYCSNSELKNLFINKKIIQIALKKDLSDIKQYPKNILVLSANDNHFAQKVINKINDAFKNEQQQLSFYQPIRTGVVIGLPNIGKSTFINKLCKKNNLIVMNKPGTTKKITIQKINEKLFLYDSPGVMFKKIDDLTTGIVLSLIGTINPKVLPIKTVYSFAIDFLKQYYVKYLINLGWNNEFSLDEFMHYLARKWNYLTKDNEVDLDLVFHKLLNIFIKGELGPLSYDDKDLLNMQTE